MKRQGNNERAKGRVCVEEDTDMFTGLQANIKYLLEEHQESTVRVELFTYLCIPNEIHSRSNGMHNSHNY
jgi:hypothetical protein